MGRFVAITNSILSLDATGFMGVYFAGKADNLACSSSPVLASELLNQPAVEGRNLKASAMNWDPVPSTRVPGLKRLFTDQSLNLTQGTTESVQRVVPTGKTACQAAENLASILTEYAESLRDLGRPIYLPLTGGTDSRAIFSALLYAGVPFQAFTFILGDHRSAVDARIAADICRKYNVSHVAIERLGENARDLERYRAHCGRVVGDRGELYVSGGYHRVFPDESLLLHGGGWEIGQRFYENRLVDMEDSSPTDALDKLCAAFGGLGEHERCALEKWLDYRIANPIKGVDLVDAFYIDQRRGGWGAVNAQEADVFGHTFIMPANSWAIVNELLSVSVEDRRANAAQIAMMNILTLGVSRVAPINPRSFAANWKRFKRSIKSVLRGPRGRVG